MGRRVVTAALLKLADRVAKAIRYAGAGSTVFNPDEVRDLCEIAANGKLSETELEFLTAAIRERLPKS